MKNFPCIACGLCCQNSYLVYELRTLMSDEGICENFDKKTKKCKIYKSRPLICNVDEMYKQKYCYKMSKKEFYLANLRICYNLNFMYGNKNNLQQLKKIIQQIKNS